MATQPTDDSFLDVFVIEDESEPDGEFVTGSAEQAYNFAKENRKLVILRRHVYLTSFVVLDFRDYEPDDDFEDDDPPDECTKAEQCVVCDHYIDENSPESSKNYCSKRCESKDLAERTPLVSEAILPSMPIEATCSGESQIQRLVRILEVRKGDGAAGALETALKELDSLIGLPSIKAEVRRLTDFLRVQAERRRHGLRESGQTLHFVFRGNPGTGKTTVARIIGRLLFGFGLLKTMKFVECGRSDLVGGYLGQTAIKTDEKIQEALEGVLFVDEAYTLTRDSEDMYGREVIDTLVKRMEDYRDRLTIIVAGYPNLMDGFVNANPCLRSRFTRFLTFDDYSPDDLLQIFDKFCNDSQYVPDAACVQSLVTLFGHAYRERDETFGNARYVRNVFQEAVTLHSQRLARLPRENIGADELTRLDARDLPLSDTLIEIGKRRGFLSVKLLNDVLLADCSDNEIRELLDLLERNGIEVISESDATERQRQLSETAKKASGRPT